MYLYFFLYFNKNYTVYFYFVYLKILFREGTLWSLLSKRSVETKRLRTLIVERTLSGKAID